jgi:hypothetical protein
LGKYKLMTAPSPQGDIFFFNFVVEKCLESPKNYEKIKHMPRKNYSGVNVRLSGGSSVRKPGSEDLRWRQRNLY